MSAQPITQQPPRLRIVPSDDTRDRFWNLVVMKTYARRAYDFAVGSVKAGGQWLRSALHLDPVIDLGRRIVGFVVGKVQYGLSLLGVTGAVGIGLGLVGSERGRTVLDATLGRAVRFVGRALTWTHDTVTNGLDRLGTPGQWVASRITDTFDFFAGNSGKPGLVARIKDVWKTAMQMDLDSNRVFTRSLGVLGTTVLANRLITIGLHFGLPYMLGTVLRFLVIVVEGMRCDGLRRDALALFDAPKKPRVKIVPDSTTEEIVDEAEQVVKEAEQNGQTPVRNHQQALKEAKAVAEATITAPVNRSERRHPAKAASRR